MNRPLTTFTSIIAVIHAVMADNIVISYDNLFSEPIHIPDTEGNTAHPQGYAITLVPTGVDYPYSNYNTSDDEWFWRAPYGR